MMTARNPNATIPSDGRPIMPMVSNTKAGLVYQRDSEQLIYQLLPSFAPLYCYVSSRTNLVFGCENRYPSDRESLGPAFAATYAQFLVDTVPKAPVSMIRVTNIDDVP